MRSDWNCLNVTFLPPAMSVSGATTVTTSPGVTLTKGANAFWMAKGLRAHHTKPKANSTKKAARPLTTQVNCLLRSLESGLLQEGQRPNCRLSVG